MHQGVVATILTLLSLAVGFGIIVVAVNMGAALSP